MTPLQWFLTYLKKYRAYLISAMLMVLLASMIAAITPVITGWIVDDVITGKEYDRLLPYLAIILGATCLRSILRFNFTMFFEKASQGTLYSMREEIYKKLLREDFSFFNTNRTGDLMSRQTGDMDAIRHFIAYVIYQLLENGSLFIFALIMVFTVNVRLALCMLVVLPLTAACTYFQSRAIKPSFARIRDRFSSLNTFAQENISGNRVVKAFAKEDYELEKFDRENDAYRDAQLRSARVWMRYIPAFELLSNALTVLVFLAGGYLVIQKQMTLGALVTVNGYLWMLNNPLRMIGWLINDTLRFITSLEKIYGTYTMEPKIQIPDNAIHPDVIQGNVTFRHVFFHAHDHVILKDICFEAHRGETIGIIGATGSGKSSLVNLICRFYDVNDGEVMVDGIDVRKMDIRTLRANIGMAMQDVFLFSDTIEGNIAYGAPDCAFADVERAARIANADAFIRQMPEGYDTIIGERGVGLSGGQKQRISLARALLKNPAILILDDTTSAIDMETEAQIQGELTRLSDNRTVFIIAHRISSIIHADQILVLDNGRIIEQGTHQQLLDRCGMYYTVFHHQYGEFNEFSSLKYREGGAL